MIKNTKDRITTPQAAVILSSTMISVETLTFPRAVSEKTGTPDVWIVVILGGLIILIASFIITNLNKRFPGKTLYQYSQEITGKGLGFILTLSLIIHLLFSAAFEVRVMAEVTQLYLLEGTPISFIIMTMMWVGVYLVFGGINPIARLCEVILPITLFIFLLVMCLSLKVFEINHLRPVLGLGTLPVIKGVPSTFQAYRGFEIMVIWLAFMEEPNKAKRIAFIGILIPVIVYLIVTVIVIGGLSVNETQTLLWPTIEVIREFELEGLLFERFESFLLAVWIMQIFTTFILYYYLASLGLVQIFRKKFTSCIYLLLPFIYLIAMYTQNINSLLKLGDVIGYTALFFGGALPVILLIVMFIRRRMHGKAS